MEEENDIKIDISKHEFVPKHELLSDKESEKLLKELGVTRLQLPKILKKDRAIHHLKAKRGDIIKITRNSKTAGKAIYYRVVI